MSLHEKELREMVEQYLEGTSLFLTGIQIKPGDTIVITIDSDTSVSVNDCEQLHRFLLRQLGNVALNYDITVSSHGLNNPLVVHRQFQKYTGKQLSIQTHTGEKFKGKLMKADEQHIIIEVFSSDKKNTSTKVLTLPYSEISRALPLIEF